MIVGTTKRIVYSMPKHNHGRRASHNAEAGFLLVLLVKTLRGIAKVVAPKSLKW